MQRGRRARVLCVVLVWTLACSGYVGSASARRDGGADDVDRRAPHCAPTAACDPVAERGCAAGARCHLVALRPWTVDCAPPGRLGLGAPCDAGATDARCADGLQCLAGQCLRPCCAGDDASCRARSPRSACAVALGDASLAACTVPGDCAWGPDDTCPKGAQCFPTTARGEAACLPYGRLTAGAACAGSGCGAGLTCIASGGDAGVCRPVCLPRGGPPCARGQCRPVAGRPDTYGACEE